MQPKRHVQKANNNIAFSRWVFEFADSPWFPAPDLVLIHKLMIEADEAEYLQTVGALARYNPGGHQPGLWIRRLTPDESRRFRTPPGRGCP